MIKKILDGVDFIAKLIGYVVIGLVIYSATTGNIHHIKDGKSSIVIKWGKE